MTMTAPPREPQNLYDALSTIYDWLCDDRLTQWPYMENGPFYSDLPKYQEVARAALAAAPAPSAEPHRFDVFRICDAYESGIGHGLKRDGLCNPYPPASDDFRAYEIGYEEGARRAIDDDSQALAKASAEPPAQAATERMGTHWETCATDGGPRHYDCALRLIEQQAREIAELTAEARTANERHHVETERRVRAEAERDTLAAIVRDLIAWRERWTPAHQDESPEWRAARIARAKVPKP